MRKLLFLGLLPVLVISVAIMGSMWSDTASATSGLADPNRVCGPGTGAAGLAAESESPTPVGFDCTYVSTLSSYSSTFPYSATNLTPDDCAVGDSCSITTQTCIVEPAAGCPGAGFAAGSTPIAPSVTGITSSAFNFATDAQIPNGANVGDLIVRITLQLGGPAFADCQTAGTTAAATLAGGQKDAAIGSAAGYPTYPYPNANGSTNDASLFGPWLTTPIASLGGGNVLLARPFNSAWPEDLDLERWAIEASFASMGNSLTLWSRSVILVNLDGSTATVIPGPNTGGPPNGNSGFDLGTNSIAGPAAAGGTVIPTVTAGDVPINILVWKVTAGPAIGQWISVSFTADSLNGPRPDLGIAFTGDYPGDTDPAASTITTCDPFTSLATSGLPNTPQGITDDPATAVNESTTSVNYRECLAAGTYPFKAIIDPDARAVTGIGATGSDPDDVGNRFDLSTCGAHPFIAHDVDATFSITSGIGLGGDKTTAAACAPLSPPCGVKVTDVKAHCKNETAAENVRCTVQVGGLPAGCTAQSSGHDKIFTPTTNTNELGDDVIVYGPTGPDYDPSALLLDITDTYAMGQTRNYDFKLKVVCSPNLASGVPAVILTFNGCADGGFIDPAHPCQDSDNHIDSSPAQITRFVKLHR